MTTDQYWKHEQNKQFTDYLRNDDALTLAIEWIRDNLEPDAVFTPQTLREWCQENSDPSDVFPDCELETWARQNDFVEAPVE